MGSQPMLERFRLLDSGEGVRALINASVAQAPDGDLAQLVSESVDRLSVWVACDRRCHVCSGTIHPDELEVECFGGDFEHSMPVHRGCFQVRAESSSDAIKFAMKFGFWVMMRIQHEEHKQWRVPLVEAWVAERGQEVGALISAPNVPGWSVDSSIDSPDELVRFTRNLFLFEREPPKWLSVGQEVPIWDETMAWKKYKTKHFQPAYVKMKDRVQRERKTLLPAEDILGRTGGFCALCGGTVRQDKAIKKDDLGLAKDHIHPFCKGGSDDLLNLQPLHNFCNGAISSVGPGEIPLGLELGRWLMQLVSRSRGEPWVGLLLETYGLKLRADRSAAARRKMSRGSSAT
ncbi:MAG: HNH endonuclease [Planctomycetes bacterium]|nr:HNH endonuclease [Planctomycetota bacterium]